MATQTVTTTREFNANGLCIKEVVTTVDDSLSFGSATDIPDLPETTHTEAPDAPVINQVSEDLTYRSYL